MGKERVRSGREKEKNQKDTQMRKESMAVIQRETERETQEQKETESERY